MTRASALTCQRTWPPSSESFSAAELKSILTGLRSLPGDPMSDSGIQSEINLVRAERRESESRC